MLQNVHMRKQIQETPNKMKQTKIVIAGGGFAGLTAATYLDKRLAHRDDIEVVLINRENFILFTPMLHEVAAGDLNPTDIVNPLRRILRRVKLVQADLQSIDPSVRRVRCRGGVAQLEFEFEYDHLLLALGSETNFLDVPGLSAHKSKKASGFAMTFPAG
jgi:NADH dehydrogenase